MHPEFEVIAHLPDCKNGSCPTVGRNPSTGRVRLRGYDPQDPTRDLDVEWSAEDLAHLVPQLVAALHG